MLSEAAETGGGAMGPAGATKVMVTWPWPPPTPAVFIWRMPAL